MAYKVIILYRLYMPSYVLGTFTEYPLLERYTKVIISTHISFIPGKANCKVHSANTLVRR